jgi:hypothetical protein
LGLLIFSGAADGEVRVCLLGVLFCVFTVVFLMGCAVFGRKQISAAAAALRGEAESVISFYEDSFGSISEAHRCHAFLPADRQGFETKNIYFLMLSTKIDSCWICGVLWKTGLNSGGHTGARSRRGR